MSPEDWKRACKLIDHMAGYVGKMAPGSYANFYADLNEHFISANKKTPPPAGMQGLPNTGPDAIPGRRQPPPRGRTR